MDLYYLMMNLMMDQWNHVVATQRYAACIHLANYEGPEAMQDRVNIARQTAMHMMRYCTARTLGTFTCSGRLQ